MDRVKSRSVDIDPRGEITWDTTDATIGFHSGTLFTAPNCPVEDPVLSLQRFVNGQGNHEHLDFGAHGNVYATPDNLAVKDFTIGGDISYLRANVILAEGLKHVAQPKSKQFAIRGLEIHAAFIPENYESREMGVRCLWLMELVDEQRSGKGKPPSYEYQKNLYLEAIDRYKVTDYDICFDCGITGYHQPWHNLMVEKQSPDPGTRSYVKIDSMPAPGSVLGRY